METIDSNLINEIITASKLIVDKTNPSDHLIFIGQSPDYLSYMVSLKRKISRIPMSGRVYCDEWTIPPTDKLENFFTLIDKFQLDYTNIVLIDHSHSGISISGFSKLLNRYFGFIDKNNTQWDYMQTAHTFPFINLISPGQKLGWISRPEPAFIKMRGFIIIPGLVDLANSKYPRTIKHAQFNSWNELTNPVDEYVKNYQILCDKIQTQLDSQNFILDYQIEFCTCINFYKSCLF
jgi:hypothetical protein